MTRPEILRVANLGQAILSATLLVLQIADLLKRKSVQTDVGSPASS